MLKAKPVRKGEPVLDPKVQAHWTQLPFSSSTGFSLPRKVDHQMEGDEVPWVQRPSNLDLGRPDFARVLFLSPLEVFQKLVAEPLPLQEGPFQIGDLSLGEVLQLQRVDPGLLPLAALSRFLDGGLHPFGLGHRSHYTDPR